MKRLMAMLLGVVFFSSQSYAQTDIYDGIGDSSSRPDIWMVPLDNNQTIILPGDNQPATSSFSGNRETINFGTGDDSFSPDSEVVIPDIDYSDDSCCQ